MVEAAAVAAVPRTNGASVGVTDVPVVAAGTCRKAGGGGLATGACAGALIHTEELLAPVDAACCGGRDKEVVVVACRGGVCLGRASCALNVGCHARGGVGLPATGGAAASG